jgi:hypothetical protein
MRYNWKEARYDMVYIILAIVSHILSADISEKEKGDINEASCVC